MIELHLRRVSRLVARGATLGATIGATSPYDWVMESGRVGIGSPSLDVELEIAASGWPFAIPDDFPVPELAADIWRLYGQIDNSFRRGGRFVLDLSHTTHRPASPAMFMPFAVAFPASRLDTMLNSLSGTLLTAEFGTDLFSHLFGAALTLVSAVVIHTQSRSEKMYEFTDKEIGKVIEYNLPHHVEKMAKALGIGRKTSKALELCIQVLDSMNGFDPYAEKWQQPKELWRGNLSAHCLGTGYWMLRHSFGAVAGPRCGDSAQLNAGNSIVSMSRGKPHCASMDATALGGAFIAAAHSMLPGGVKPSTYVGWETRMNELVSGD